MAFLSKFSRFGVQPWIKSIFKPLSAGLGWVIHLAKRFPRLSLSALGIFYFGLVFVLSVWFYLKHEIKGQIVEVPELVNLEYRQAEAQILAVGLVPKLITDKDLYSPNVPANHVLSQLPRAGRVVKQGREVEITLSAGVEAKKIPNLAGNGLSFAETLARQAETRVAHKTYVPSQTVGRGQVIAQYPAPGEELGAAHGVSVLISTGRQETFYVMPNLVGRDYAAVKKFLDDHNLRHVVKSSVPSEIPAGPVTSQSPGVGEPVSSLQNITLTLN